MSSFNMMDMPSTFWKTLSPEEDEEIFRTGMLNRKMCRRLWAMLGRTDKPPRELMVLVKEEDLQRLLSEHRKH